MIEPADDAPSPEASCPKHMRFGPCGGPHFDGRCEVGPFPCPFVDRPLAEGPSATGPSLAVGAASPVVLVDVRAPSPPAPSPPDLWVRTAAALQGCWALIGDHVDNPVWAGDAGYTPPEEAVATLVAGGVPTIATVTGRHHGVDGAAARARSLRDAGATAVHCVTGDHPAALGIDRPVSFGAESITIVAAASTAGVPTTVAESPASPGPRVARLLAKQRAGAGAAVLNHAGPARALVAFADACADAGVDLPLVAPVPMVVDVRRAAALAAFPGLQLVPGMLDAIAGAADPLAEGLRWAGDLADELHDSGRFAGINLSGAAGGDHPYERLEVTRRFVERIRRVRP